MPEKHGQLFRKGVNFSWYTESISTELCDRSDKGFDITVANDWADFYKLRVLD